MANTFERVTFFCRDLEASLKFYRDGLGLCVVEQKTLEGAAAGGLLQLPPCRIRIALLAAEPDSTAFLGLFEITGTPLDAIVAMRGRPTYGQSALVISTDRFDAIAEALDRAGVQFLTPPLRYPKRVASERSPAGLYREMIFYDPDGFLLSVMQIDPLPDDDAA